MAPSSLQLTQPAVLESASKDAPCPRCTPSSSSFLYTYSHLHILSFVHTLICIYSYLHILSSAHTLIYTCSCWHATLLKRSFDTALLKYLFRSLWRIFCYFCISAGFQYISGEKSLWRNNLVVLPGGSVSRSETNFLRKIGYFSRKRTFKSLREGFRKKNPYF